MCYGMIISPNTNGYEQAELLPSRSKERDPAVLQGHCLPLTDLSCATNEISRSVKQSTFGLIIKSVKIASKNFSSLLRFGHSCYLNILTLYRRSAGCFI